MTATVITEMIEPVIAPEPQQSARMVGLRYVSDETPGWRRVPRGEAFKYVDAEGKSVRDAEALSRIRSLAIPPAWTEVWICPLAHGHLQATGRDARGRKQHRYHPRWREVRDETKFNRMIAFAKVLPRLRRRVTRDLALPGLPRNKVLATVVRLLEVSLIRVGNEEYARANHSYGLTTLRDRHVRVKGDKLHFQFKGKSGQFHQVEIVDRRLARIVRRCQDLPGQELFQYLDEEGVRHDVGSGDVNDYLREITGQEFSAKDFRTWAGTILAAMALQEFETVDSQAKAKKNVVRAIEAVSSRLGNTPAICRKCYVHPAILEAYFEGTLAQMLQERARQQMARRLSQLNPEEAAVLTLLERRLGREGQQVKKQSPTPRFQVGRK